MKQSLSTSDSISAELEQKLSLLDESETLLDRSYTLGAKNKKRIFTRNIRIKVYKLQEVGFNDTLFDKL